MKLLRYVTAFDIFVLVCEGIFCAFILYYIIEEIIEIWKHRLSYFKSFWNILDVLVICIALCCIGFSIYRQVMVNTKLDDLLRNERQYANFEFLSFAQTRFNDFVAIMIFFAWVKIFKYISFNKTMNQLSSTLSRCAKDVGGFAVMFFIFFFAYAQLGYLIFGTQVSLPQLPLKPLSLRASRDQHELSTIGASSRRERNMNGWLGFAGEGLLDVLRRGVHAAANDPG